MEFALLKDAVKGEHFYNIFALVLCDWKNLQANPYAQWWISVMAMAE